jgi:type II secretory ATPase GspE/PulE/Tfp pilus assembly ATPase PilB-like protein
MVEEGYEWEEGRVLERRVSSMPTLLGEKLVVRILDKAT